MKGKEIRFKGSWSGHEFTDEEIKALLAGEEISIKAKKKNGEDWEVKRSLALQTYKGVKSYGFKPVLEHKGREGK